MSPRITHSKVSGKPNPTDASKVGGEDWDADHVIDGLTIGTDVQAHDTTLDALAAFDSNGILVQYGTDQFTARTLTGTANEITVTNGAGASGNPTISLPSALTFTGKTVTGGTFSDVLSLSATSTNPATAIHPLSSFYSPTTDPLSKGTVGIQSIRTSGGLGITDAALIVNTEVTGATGAVGAIIGGTLNKSGISTLDSFGILGLINNDAATTFPTGAAVWGIVRGEKASNGYVDGLRSTSEVTVSGEKPRAGLLVSSTLDTNAFNFGAWVIGANNYGFLVGSEGGTGTGVVMPTVPFGAYTYGLGTTPHDGLFLANIAPAAAGAQQMSSRIRWLGKGWKTDATAASQSVEWTVDLLPVQGSSAPTGNLIFASRINNGTLDNRVWFTSSNGVGVGTLPSASAGNGDLSLGGKLWANGDIVLTHPLTPTPDHTASSNITLGVGAGAALAPIHSTEYLTLLGFQAGAALTTEDHITAVGAWSLSSYNAGGTNTGITAIGIDSMRSLTSGQQNVAVGEHTLTGATSASYTTAVGYNAMLSFGNGGTYNSAFGYFALNGSAVTPATGLGNTAIGSYALTGIAGTGAYNTAVGMQALSAVAQANGNVGIGYQAGLTVTTGYANTIIGTFAGAATLATGHDNILIGTTNNIADTPAAGTSNYLNIGNFIYGTSAGLTISPITTASATLTGSSSGSTKLQAASAASGTLTLPAATDTLVGKDTTDTLTNKSMDGGSNTFTNIPIGSAISGLGTGVAAALASGVREKLTANRTYYVRTDGSDSNTGLANTSGGAFLTLQKAYDTITANLDLGGQAVTVQIGDGTYTGGLAVSQPWTGGGSVTFQGNNATPANVVISTTSADCVKVSTPLPGVLTINDLKMQTTTAGSCINVVAPAIVNSSNVNFGDAADFHIAAQAPGALIKMTTAYTISGGATTHWLASSGGSVTDASKTITLSGTPAFSFAVAYATRLGSMTLMGDTFSGTATGTRYLGDTNAVIFTNGAGATYLPGDVAGNTATGAQYV